MQKKIIKCLLIISMLALFTGCKPSKDSHATQANLDTQGKEKYSKECLAAHDAYMFHQCTEKHPGAPEKSPHKLNCKLAMKAIVRHCLHNK